MAVLRIEKVTLSMAIALRSLASSLAYGFGLGSHQLLILRSLAEPVEFCEDFIDLCVVTY